MLQQFVLGDAEVVGDIIQDSGARADFQWRVIGNGNVVLASFPGGQPQVTARLAGDLITPCAEQIRKLEGG